MPILYESYSPLQRKLSPSRVRAFGVIRYPLPFPITVGCGTTRKSLDFPKLPSGTIVQSVSLKATGDLVTSGTPLTPVSAEVVFLVNGQAVSSQGWYLCWRPRCTSPFDFYPNIGAYIYWDKTNDFEIEVRQSYSPVGCVTGVENISAYIEIEYTGTPPSQPKPPPPEWWGYVKWGMVGVGAIAVIGLVLPKAIEAIRKPKG